MANASAGTAVPERAKTTKRGRAKATHTDPRGRESRAQVDRSSEMDRGVEDKPYTRPSSLAAPAARTGMKQRWVHVGVDGRWDDKNWARKQREGWSPRASSTVPKNFQVPRIEHGRFAGCIGVEGMVLCEMTLGQAKKRRDYYADQTKRRTTAVDDDIRRVNRVAGAGFGPIKKAERSTVVREVASGKDAGTSDEVDLS